MTSNPSHDIKYILVKGGVWGVVNQNLITTLSNPQYNNRLWIIIIILLIEYEIKKFKIKK